MSVIESILSMFLGELLASKISNWISFLVITFCFVVLCYVLIVRFGPELTPLSNSFLGSKSNIS